MGASLNDHLLTCLLNSLFGVLMRFRQEKIALSADVESMFSQVAVLEDDQTVLRFPWRNNHCSKPPDVYQFCSHIFGAKSSPISANYALHQTAKDNADEFPVAAETVLKNFYMDDLFKSEDSDDIAVKAQENVSEVLRRGEFRLTKWCSTSRNVLACIPESELAPSLKNLDLGDQLPRVEELAPFIDWLRELVCLSSFEEPRFYRAVPTKPMSIQLHVFGDASTNAFCGVAYFRFQYSDGSIQCSFVMGKTRVAPLRQLSIPKLELQTAVMCVRVLETVKREHTYAIDGSHLWTDSSTVLQWIQSSSRRHPTFIANRVAEIQYSTDPLQWRQVPGRLNVADEGSRGLKASELSPDWPTQKSQTELNESDITESTDAEDWTGVTHDMESPILDPARFSSWDKLIRSTSYLLRFINNCRKPNGERQFGAITVAECDKAKLVWFKKAQVVLLKSVASGPKHHAISRQSRLLALTPFVDETGILRAGGRLPKAPVSYSTRHPIILPHKHDVTRLIITDYHQRSHHEGNEHVRNAIRKDFWVLNCRSSIRKVSYECPYCRRRRARPHAPMMANLPSVRMKAYSPPFSHIGVDYFGPLTVKRFRKTEKRYGCLFTCLVTRAIHIEVAHSLYTDSYIMALRRLISRRGKPQLIQSDNGTNFVGADRELKECLDNLNKEKIRNTMVYEGIEWRFNPPAAPHFGGIWERLVQSCKRAIKAILGNQTVTDEVLITVMAEVEALLNSRPLTHVSTHFHDDEALTPNHFLLGRSNPNLPPGVFVDKEISSAGRWRQAQVLTNHFWRRWIKEYIPSLLQRKKWTTTTRNMKKGDLVLMADPATPRGRSPLVRVIRSIVGDSGVVRAVDVKTKTGTYVHPVTKIALLEEADTTLEECVSTSEADGGHGAANVPSAP